MIGGNTSADIQVKGNSVRNEIGALSVSWETVQTFKEGWLDLTSGDSKYSSFNAKIQESTHVFLCDYAPLDKRIKAENSRMLINGMVFDILLIDDPMDLHQQYEIYLKYTGGQ